MKTDQTPQNSATCELNEAQLIDLAEFFKVFGDSTRVMILHDLFGGERNVSEICEDLAMNQSAISHQLRILKNAKLVRARREGKSIYYSLADAHIVAIMAMAGEHIKE